MVRLVGQKKAREMWFLARLYSAQDALDMGLINKVPRCSSRTDDCWLPKVAAPHRLTEKCMHQRLCRRTEEICRWCPWRN